MGTDARAIPSGLVQMYECGCCVMVTSAFQADDTGSIPVTRLSRPAGGHFTGHQDDHAALVQLDLHAVKGFRRLG